MGLDERDLPEGVDDFPDAAYQTGVRAQSSSDAAKKPDRLPNSGTRIPDNRADLIDLLEDRERVEAELSAHVLEATRLVAAAEEERNRVYGLRQDVRQDVRVLRGRIVATLPTYDDNSRP